MVEAVTLRAITDHNLPAMLELRVAAAQEDFVDGVARSLGFVLLAAGNPHVPWPFYLWRMLIDHRWQGSGYGRAALDAVVAYVAGVLRTAGYSMSSSAVWGVVVRMMRP